MENLKAVIFKRKSGTSDAFIVVPYLSLNKIKIGSNAYELTFPNSGIGKLGTTWDLQIVLSGAYSSNPFLDYVDRSFTNFSSPPSKTIQYQVP